MAYCNKRVLYIQLVKSLVRLKIILNDNLMANVIIFLKIGTMYIYIDIKDWK